MKGFVVAVSGIPGCGGPELCDELARKLPRSIAVHLQEHPGSRWLKGEGFDALDLGDLCADIKRLAAGRKYDCILLDCPIGRCSKELAEVIDFVFYLDIPADLALARSLSRDTRLTDRELLRSRLRLYQEQGRFIAEKIQRTVPQNADVTVNAENDPEETVLNFIKTLLINRFIKF